MNRLLDWLDEWALWVLLLAVLTFVALLAQ